MAQSPGREAALQGAEPVFLIFLTGAVVLALEVLSSRIMTPYFGVSLYIWASILSTTLAFLAFGYHLGGLATRRLPAPWLPTIYLLLPVGSAASVLLAVALFPALFPVLARFDLIFGSFLAGSILLALPLVCLSAMNPLLIALRLGDGPAGDAGAGQVFFVSTIGSVAGVVATAFLIIPNLTNFSALLWLALVLCVTSVAYAWLWGLPGRHWLRLLAGAAAVALLALLLLFFQARYLALAAGSGDRDARLTILDEYTSVFGDLKVVELGSLSRRYPTIKVLLQDGVIQNRTSLEDRSLSMYTYVLDSLAKGFVPEGRSALVLGLGAGIVPRDLRRRGLDVTIVDINPTMLRAAVEHFGFRPDAFTLRLADARTFVRRCPERYDVIVVDLFQGDGTPDYLLTKEFFGDLRGCLSARGAVVMNAFFDPKNAAPNKRLLATVHDAFPRLFYFHRPELNTFVVGLAGALPASIDFPIHDVPPGLHGLVQRALRSGVAVKADDLLGFAPLTDQQNLFSILAADAKMGRRREVVEVLPPRVLVN